HQMDDPSHHRAMPEGLWHLRGVQDARGRLVEDGRCGLIQDDDGVWIQNRRRRLWAAETSRVRKELARRNLTEAEQQALRYRSAALAAADIAPHLSPV